MALSRRDIDHVFERLRSGVVPERGLDAFAVGIDRQRNEILRQLDMAEAGEGVFKFLRGGYGCGKTFMARLAQLEAQRRGFATSFVVVSPNDTHFDRFDAVYRKIVQELGTSTCPRGALNDIVDRWIAKVEDGLIAGGAEEGDAGFDALVQRRIEEEVASLTGEKAPEDFARVLRTVFTLKQEGKVQEAGSLLSWLSGSQNVAASEKSAAGVKGTVTQESAMLYLHGILEIVKAAGYKGLVIIIDEAETILRMRSDSRAKSLIGIRQIIDAADRYKGLLWVFTGTPEFFDAKRGVAGLQPLHDRIQFMNEGGVVTMRQSQLELKPFDKERLKDVGLRLRQLYPGGDPNIVAQKVTPERIVEMVEDLTKGFGGDVGVVPRQFLRKLVNEFDKVAEGLDSPEPPPTVEEERAKEGKKPYTYEPEADDDKGYVDTGVKF